MHFSQPEKQQTLQRMGVWIRLKSPFADCSKAMYRKGDISINDALRLWSILKPTILGTEINGISWLVSRSRCI